MVWIFFHELFMSVRLHSLATGEKIHLPLHLEQISHHSRNSGLARPRVAFTNDRRTHVSVVIDVDKKIEPWNTMCKVGLPPGEGWHHPKKHRRGPHRRKHLALPRCLVFPSPSLSYAAPSGVWRKVILRTSCNERIFEGLMILRNQRTMHSQWHLDSTLFHRFQTNDAIQAFECSLFIAAGPWKNSLLDNPSV